MPGAKLVLPPPPKFRTFLKKTDRSSERFGNSQFFSDGLFGNDIFINNSSTFNYLYIYIHDMYHDINCTVYSIYIILSINT